MVVFVLVLMLVLVLVLGMELQLFLLLTDGLGVVGCRVGCRVVGRRVVVGLDISAVSLVSTTITE